MWNNITVQGPSSDKYGHFCIYYSYFKSKGFTMSCILLSFTMDQAIIDYIVEDFVKNEMFIRTHSGSECVFNYLFPTF